MTCEPLAENDEPFCDETVYFELLTRLRDVLRHQGGCFSISHDPRIPECTCFNAAPTTTTKE